MAAVLLWLPWPDKLDFDSESQPRGQQLREIEQGVGTGEGHAIVRAIWPKAGRVRDLPRVSFSCAKPWSRPERTSPSRLSSGCLAAVAAIAELELAFEIGTQELVWRAALG